MHPVAAGLVAVAVAFFMVYYAFQQVQVYQAQSLVYVEPVVARNLNEQGAPGFDQFRYGSFVDQQMQTAMRPDVLTAALRSLPAGTWRKPKETEQSAVLRLQKSLVVERLLTSYQMSIKLKADSAQSVAAVVNAVTNAYMQSGRNDELSMSRERQVLLTEERQRISEQLDADQKEQAALGNKLGVANPENSATNPFDAETANLRLQLATARQSRDVAQAQLASISGPEASHRSGLTAAADETLTTDLGLSSMKSSVNARRALLQSQMAGLTPNNPTYRQDQDELADLDRSVESMSAQMRSRAEHRIEDRLRTELQRTADVEAQLNRQLSAETARAAGAGPKLQRASELGVDIQRLHAQYTSVDDALNALELQTNGPAMAHIALTAAVPAAPEPSRRGLFLMAAVPFGLLCGIATAVLLRTRDHRLYMAKDLEELIGFAPIAVMPSREDVAPRVADQYVLRLAAGIEHAYRTDGAQTFIVTAVSGSTDTAALLQALANKLEHMRLEVAVRRAGELLIMSRESAEYLAHHAQAVPPQQHTSEGVAAAKLQRLKSEHAIVLIDGAPLLHSAETEYAARCADATILVIESGVTLSEEVTDATALLSRMRVSGIAVVLSDVKLKDADPAFRQAVMLAERRNLENAAPARQAGDPQVDSNDTHQAVAETAEEVAHGAPGSFEPVHAAFDPILESTQEGPLVALTSEAYEHEYGADDTGSQPATAAGARQDVAETSLTLIGAEPVFAPTAEVVEVLGEHAVHSKYLDPAESAANSVTLMAEANDTLAPIHGYDRFHSPEAEFSEGVSQEPYDASAAPLVAALPLTPLLLVPEAMPFPQGSEPIAPLHQDPSAIEEPVAAEAVELEPVSTELIPVATPSLAPSLVAATEAAPADSMGTLFDREDRGGTIPPYTRSRIRTTFKEQEVNAKTAWFSKLFRGDPSSTPRMLPAEQVPGTDQFSARNATSNQAVYADRPQLEDLLRRINSRAYKVPGREFDTPGVAPLSERTPAPAQIDEAAAIDSLINGEELDLATRRQPLPVLQGGNGATGQAVARRDAVQPINEEGFVRELERLSTLKAPIWPAKASGRNLSGARARAAASRSFGSDRSVAKDLDSRIHSLTNGSSRVDRARSNSSQRAASRLDPIVPLRAEPAPWHERLSSMRPAAPLPASTAATEPSGMRRVAAPRLLEPHLVVPIPAEQPASSPSVEPETITSRAPEALAALAAAAPSAAGPRGLTRRWGLLSQYDPTAGAPSDATRMHRAQARSRRFQEQD